HEQEGARDPRGAAEGRRLMRLTQGLDSESYSENKLVLLTASGLLLLAVGIADSKWGVAVLGAVIASGAGFWSVHALDHGSTRRRVGWLGAQVIALAIGAGVALAAGLDGWWIAVPVIPALVIGSWIGTRILNGPPASVSAGERPNTEVMKRWSLGR